MTLNNNLSLKLYVMLITYYIIIISGNQELVRRSSNEVVKTVAKTVVVQRITRKILQRQFPGNGIIRSLGNKLLRDEIQEVDLCANDYRCKSILEFYLKVRMQMSQMLKDLIFILILLTSFLILTLIQGSFSDLCQMQFTPYYLRSSKVSWKSKYIRQYII